MSQAARTADVLDFSAYRRERKKVWVLATINLAQRDPATFPLVRWIWDMVRAPDRYEVTVRETRELRDGSTITFEGVVMRYKNSVEVEYALFNAAARASEADLFEYANNTGEPNSLFVNPEWALNQPQ